MAAATTQSRHLHRHVGSRPRDNVSLSPACFATIARACCGYGRTRSQVALITGAARRIGAVIARDLGRDGWAVAVHYRGSASEAAEVVADIEAEGGRAAAFAADLMSEAETISLVGRACDTLGRVTCLINNASLFERDEPLTATRDSWHRHMQVDLRAPFLLTQTSLDKCRKTRAAVINILDQRVWNLTPHFTSYTVSKAGLWTLTKTLALALAPRVRVNAVGPGPTLPASGRARINSRGNGRRFRWRVV